MLSVGILFTFSCIAHKAMIQIMCPMGMTDGAARGNENPLYII